MIFPSVQNAVNIISLLQLWRSPSIHNGHTSHNLRKRIMFNSILRPFLRCPNGTHLSTYYLRSSELFTLEVVCPCVWYNADIPEVYQCTWEITHTETWNITSITIQTSFSRWFSLHKWFDLTPFSSGVEYIVDLVVGARVHSKNSSGMIIVLMKLFWLNEKE